MRRTVGLLQNGGKICKYTSVSGISSNDNQISDFNLYQNFPNPFNPTTRISWQSPVSSWQTLKVYDVIGKEVVTLVDEYRPSGNYDVEFDASSLSSGIYFYQLKAAVYLKQEK